MWPFFYTLAFGLTGAYCAKKMKKNPYIWFGIGCLCKGYLLLFIFLSPILKILSLYFFRKKVFSTIKKPSTMQEDTTTIEVPSYAELSIDAVSAEKLWYYLTADSQTKGPMSFQAFYKDWKAGKISKEMYIWNETLTEWTLFKNIFPV